MRAVRPPAGYCQPGGGTMHVFAYQGEFPGRMQIDVGSLAMETAST